MKESKASFLGLCQIWDKIYFECFDELIRQEVVSNKKQGILLSYFRDNYKQVLDYYSN